MYTIPEPSLTRGGSVGTTRAARRWCVCRRRGEIWRKFQIFRARSASARTERCPGYYLWLPNTTYVYWGLLGLVTVGHHARPMLGTRPPHICAALTYHLRHLAVIRCSVTADSHEVITHPGTLSLCGLVLRTSVLCWTTGARLDAPRLSSVLVRSKILDSNGSRLASCVN